MQPKKFFNGQFVMSKYVERGVGRHETFNQQFQDFLNDGSIPVGNATPSYREQFPEFSVNKRKRWLLPKLLKETIEENEDIDELPFRVCLVERAIQSRVAGDDMSINRCQRNRADCLSVIRSKSVKRKFKPKKKYSFESDLHGDRVRSWGRIEHVKDEDSQEPPPSELTYEICYPPPKTSYPAYSPFISARMQRCKRQEKLHSAKGKLREVRLQGIGSTVHFPEELQQFKGRCSVEILEDEESNVDCGRTGVDLGDVNVPPDRDQSVNLSEYFSFIPKKKISQKEQKRQHLNKAFRRAEENLFKKKERSKRKPKGSAIFDPTIPLNETEKLIEAHSPSADSGFSDGSDVVFNFDLKQDSTWQTVKLEESSLSELYLSRTFGESLMGYAESDPFCVAINLCRTDLEEEFPSQVSRLDEVVLVIQKLESRENSIWCRFRVCDLRGVSNGRTVNSSMVNIDSDRTYSTLDLVQVIKQSLSSFLKLGEDIKARSVKPKHLVRLETVTSLLDWKYESKPERDVVELIRYEEEVSCARSFGSYHPCSTQPPECCEICYDDISDIEGSTPLATALRDCGHWFCGNCWQQHVTSRTQQGDVNIKCPAHDCNSPVDTTTLLALLPDSFFPLLSRLQLNQLLSSQKVWEWCQNPKCSRMVQVGGVRSQRNGDDQMNVIRCACGHSWCYGCKEDAHWPATCQQAAEYKNYVESKGIDDGEDRITAVEVKRCPDCSYPIDKNGGCMHMSCHFCHHQFCWECLSPWEGHLFDWEKSCSAQPLESIMLSGRKTMSVEMYLKEASRWRKERLSFARISSAALHCGMSMYYQYLKTMSSHHPEPTYRSFCLFHSEYSTTWIASDAHVAEFHKILRLCERACSLCSEIAFILEHLNVLIATSKTKYLRRRCSGWKDAMDKLSFISNRLQRMLTGETDLKYPQLGEHLQRLVNAGELRLKEVVKAIPRVHTSLAAKEKMSRRDKSER